MPPCCSHHSRRDRKLVPSTHLYTLQSTGYARLDRPRDTNIMAGRRFIDIPCSGIVFSSKFSSSGWVICTDEVARSHVIGRMNNGAARLDTFDPCIFHLCFCVCLESSGVAAFPATAMMMRTIDPAADDRQTEEKGIHHAHTRVADLISSSLRVGKKHIEPPPVIFP